MFGCKDTKEFRPHYFHQRVRLMAEPHIPKILISREAYAKMWLYVDIAQEEVGWMGTVKQLPGGEFYIEKVWLLKQEVSGVETLITNDGLGEFALELLSRGDEGMEDWDNLRFWGHSHVAMGTSPSGTDQNQMRLFKDAEHPWFLRGILNKLGRIEFTLYLYEQELVVEDAAWEVVNLAAGQEVKLPGDDTPPVGSVPGWLSGAFGGGAGFYGLNSRRYNADITDELRAQVQVEFDQKVTSRGWKWLYTARPDLAAHTRAVTSTVAAEAVMAAPEAVPGAVPEDAAATQPPEDEVVTAAPEVVPGNSPENFPVVAEADEPVDGGKPAAQADVLVDGAKPVTEAAESYGGAIPAAQADELVDSGKPAALAAEPVDGVKPANQAAEPVDGLRAVSPVKL